MPTTYNKEREYIGEIAYMSKLHQFCSIIRLYGLASVIQRLIMSIYPPTVSQLISSLYNKLIEPRIKAYDEPIIIMWTPSSGKNSPPSPDQNIDIEIRDVQSDENENIPFNILESEKCMSDGSDIVEFNSNVDDNDGESSSSLSYTTNIEKNVRKKNLEKHSKTSNCLLTEGIRPLTSYFVNFTKSHQISCIRLRDEKHLEYLQRIGGIIHYGGAPRVEVLAKELFPIKFDKNFS
ncbi:unnamed protein product [Rhizophagus irregularis]|nr:unnamed protein product [Rhizophagus irregularis]CAB5301382.1 unnamed protein product [Rhizophagus irregularis]